MSSQYRKSPFQEEELVRPNRLAGEIVFADGIGSSGKGMLSHLLASLERVEKQSNHSVFDYVSYLHWMGKLSTDAAVTYLQTEADAQLYHLMMSRDVNFRPKDSTGVLQNARKFEYFRRLCQQEGDAVVQRISRSRPILNEAPHDALRSAPLFFEAFGMDLKIAYIMRDPLELILDWVRRGFGDRIGKDPREFQFSIRQGSNAVPMFMRGINENYEALNDTERVVLMIRFCVLENLRGYEALSENQRKGVRLLEFNELAENPHRVMDELAMFLGTKTLHRTSKAIKKENLPRPVRVQSAMLEDVLGRISSRFETDVVDCMNLHAKLVEFRNLQSTN